MYAEGSIGRGLGLPKPFGSQLTPSLGLNARHGRGAARFSVCLIRFEFPFGPVCPCYALLFPFEMEICILYIRSMSLHSDFIDVHS